MSVDLDPTKAAVRLQGGIFEDLFNVAGRLLIPHKPPKNKTNLHIAFAKTYRPSKKLFRHNLGRDLIGDYDESVSSRCKHCFNQASMLFIYYYPGSASAI